jgi:hypothetical protein
MYGSGVVLFGLPVDNQRLGLDPDNEVLLNVQDDHSHFSLRNIRFSGPHLESRSTISAAMYKGYLLCNMMATANAFIKRRFRC